MSHALLSPSSASRWISCTPSARFEERFESKTSAFAEEGTLAHSLGELLIQQRLGWIKKAEYKKRLAVVEDHEFYSDSMLEYCDDYATFVIERFNEALNHTPDAKLFLEKKLDMSDYVPEGFGTGDAVIVADTLMETIDLKYGKGVAVAVTENKQQMLYALGALKDFSLMYNIERLRMTVYQPRIGNIESFEMEVTDLLGWAETELKEKANMAYAGEGEFIPGSHCQFCRGASVCKALAEMNLELAKYEFAETNILSDDAIADILTRADTFIKWIDKVSEYALKEAVDNSKKWPGFKLVEGRSNRKYSDVEAVEKVLLKAGFDEETIFTKKLLPITKMETELGKKVFAQHLSSLVNKPQGKPTLVPASDKRPEFSGLESAIADFANVPTE